MADIIHARGRRGAAGAGGRRAGPGGASPLRRRPRAEGEGRGPLARARRFLRGRKERIKGRRGANRARPHLVSPRLTVPRRPRPLTSPPGPCPRRPAAATEPEPPTPMAAVTSAPTERGARRERTAGLGGRWGGGGRRAESAAAPVAHAQCVQGPRAPAPTAGAVRKWRRGRSAPLHVAPHGPPSCWCSWSHPVSFIRLMDFISPPAITVLNLSETLPPFASLMLVSQGSQAHKWFLRGVGTKQGQIRLLGYNCWVLASAEAGF